MASVLATFFLLFEITSKGFEPASLLATRAFWLAAIWLGLLVLSRATIFFTAFQMTVVLGALLSTKSFLQRFEWYAYQSDAWLHPWALQIQGSVLGLICLGWMAFQQCGCSNNTRCCAISRSWSSPHTMTKLRIAGQRALRDCDAWLGEVSAKAAEAHLPKPA